jgi:beta-phosphoglucomutase-like phosphatase (HAD superfamily)
MPKLGVIFDMDGVLVDSYQAHFESWSRLYGELGVVYSEHDFAGISGALAATFSAAALAKISRSTRSANLTSGKRHSFVRCCRIVFRQWTEPSS